MFVNVKSIIAILIIFNIISYLYLNPYRSGGGPKEPPPLVFSLPFFL